MRMSGLVFLSRVWKLFKSHKYTITLVYFAAVLGYFSDNSFFRQWKQQQEIDRMKAEIVNYENQYTHDGKLLDALEHNPSAILKIARERYLMKSKNEDIYIFEQ